MTLEPSQSEGTILFTKGIKWSSGMTVEVTLHKAAGRDYPKTINLPCLEKLPSFLFQYNRFIGQHSLAASTLGGWLKKA